MPKMLYTKADLEKFLEEHKDLPGDTKIFVIYGPGPAQVDDIYVDDEMVEETAIFIQ
jgi:hypothetical protein